MNVHHILEAVDRFLGEPLFSSEITSDRAEIVQSVQKSDKREKGVSFMYRTLRFHFPSAISALHPRIFGNSTAEQVCTLTGFLDQTRRCSLWQEPFKLALYVLQYVITPRLLVHIVVVLIRRGLFRSRQVAMTVKAIARIIRSYPDRNKAEMLINSF